MNSTLIRDEKETWESENFVRRIAPVKWVEYNDTKLALFGVLEVRWFVGWPKFYSSMARDREGNFYNVHWYDCDFSVPVDSKNHCDWKEYRVLEM